MGAVNPSISGRKQPSGGKRKTLLIVVAAATSVICGLAAIGAAVGDPASAPTATSPAPQITAAADDTATTPAVPPAPKPPPAATTKPKPKPKPSTRTTTKPPPNDHRYATCKEAKAHGLGPYYRGIDPEYYWYKDADSDGVVCE